MIVLGSISPSSSYSTIPTMPAPRFDVIKSRYNDLELSVEVFVAILDHSLVWRDLTARHALHDEVRSCLSFAFPNVVNSEQELTIQVANVNRIQIYRRTYKGMDMSYLQNHIQNKMYLKYKLTNNMNIRQSR